MTSLNETIKILANELKEESLDAIKLLRDHNILTPKEYSKCLKRIHGIKQKDDATGLKESCKTFTKTLMLQPGKYTEAINLTKHISLIGMNE